MEIINAVIPVAGAGTRLLPATKSQPKEMLPVGRKPVVQYVVEELKNSGVTNVLFVTGRNKASIENHFDYDSELVRMLRESGREDLLSTLEFEKLNLKFFYTRQKKQIGLGGAVLQAEYFTGKKPFIVANGDCIIGLYGVSSILERLASCFTEKKADAVIAFEEVAIEQTSHYGIAKPAGKGGVFPLADLIEKPAPCDAPSTLAVAGRYVFSPAVFDAIKNVKPDKKGEIQLTDAIRLLIKEGGKVYGVKLKTDEKRFDIGNFESYFASFMEFAVNDSLLGRDLKNSLRKLLK